MVSRCKRGQKMQQPPNRFTLRLLTRANSRIILGLAALVLTALLMYGSNPRSIQAAGTGFTQTQAYSSNFTMKNLSTDGTTQTTLTKIPFTVPSKGKVDVTAIFTVNILAPTGSSCLACQMGTLSCSLMLDGAPLISLNDMMHSFNLASQEYAMTTTSPVIAGTHTVALL